MKNIRSPICTVLGHVDHGKSKILDSIRGSNILKTEAGGITQAIGASVIPLDVIKNKCGDMLKSMNLNFTIPGLLFIDTPGHAAFTSLRKRGGSIADIAVLVIDINEGLMPQTIEAIEILKSSKTPFIVAANKLDLIHGWQSESKNACSILNNLSKQKPHVASSAENKLYEIVGKLSEHGLNSERFDRVEDFTKEIAIVPVSAHTGEGISSLLMVIAGLAQRFLESRLHVTEGIGAKGTILEIKEQKGLGKVMDVILYDGSLAKDDTIVIGTLEKPIVTKVKMLLEPESMAELRDKKTAYKQCSEVHAAIGVRVVAQGIEDAVAGMPVMASRQIELEATKQEVQKEVESALIETQNTGVVLKADTIGSLEAMTMLLREKEIPVMKATIGNITKKDILDADSNTESDPEYSVVLGFNVKDISEYKRDTVKVITSEIIYKILDELEYYLANFKEEQEKRELEGMTFPAKIEVLDGYIFRQSNPAVCGVHVIEGKIKVGMPILKDGKIISEVKSIQKEKDSVNVAKKDDEVAISMPRVTIGRQVFENDILYSAISEDEYRRFKELKKFLKEKEKDVLKEISSQMRKNNVVWGV